MCQLVVKDFELCFGSTMETNRLGAGGHEYFNPEESPVPEESSDIKPYTRKAKTKVMFVQAYLLPLA